MRVIRASIIHLTNYLPDIIVIRKFDGGNLE
jgi:hypothetical protein